MATIYHDYLKKIHSTYMTDDATGPSYYPLLKELLESPGKKLGMVGGVTVQPKRTKAGIPDFLLKTKAGKIVVKRWIDSSSVRYTGSFCGILWLFIEAAGLTPKSSLSTR